MKRFPGFAIFCLAVVMAMFAGFTARADVFKQATWALTGGGNGHTYKVVAKGALISWDAANTAAQAGGGYLATITSAAENDFVFSLIDDPAYWTQTENGHGPWIGGYQPTNAVEPGGGWTWVAQAGATVAEGFVYSNWEAGEPNNFTVTIAGKTDNQDRIAYFHTGTGRAATWSDEYDLTSTTLALNQWTMSYVIEFSPMRSVLAPEMLADGSLQFSFVNRVGGYFEVQMTTNLNTAGTNWTGLGTATEVSPGRYEFTDTAAGTGGSQRFYRVSSP